MTSTCNRNHIRCRSILRCILKSIEDGDPTASAELLPLVYEAGDVGRAGIISHRRNDPANAVLVKLRHFAGFSIDQAAGLLGNSRATAKRYWAFARAWLLAEVAAEPQRTTTGNDQSAAMAGAEFRLARKKNPSNGKPSWRSGKPPGKLNRPGMRSKPVAIRLPLYSLDSQGFDQMDEWLAPFRRFWAPKFEALAREVARGKRSKKRL